MRCGITCTSFMQSYNTTSGHKVQKMLQKICSFISFFCLTIKIIINCQYNPSVKISPNINNCLKLKRWWWWEPTYTEHNPVSVKWRIEKSRPQHQTRIDDAKNYSSCAVRTSSEWLPWKKTQKKLSRLVSWHYFVPSLRIIFRAEISPLYQV